MSWKEMKTRSQGGTKKRGGGGGGGGGEEGAESWWYCRAIDVYLSDRCDNFCVGCRSFRRTPPRTLLRTASLQRTSPGTAMPISNAVSLETRFNLVVLMSWVGCILLSVQLTRLGFS